MHGTKTPRWVRRHAPGCIKFKTMWGTTRYWRETEALGRWAGGVVAASRNALKKRWGRREAQARKALARKAKELM